MVISAVGNSKRRGIGSPGRGEEGATVFIQGNQEGLTAKVTLEQTPEGDKGRFQTDLRGKSASGKGLEVGCAWHCLRNKEGRVAGQKTVSKWHFVLFYG